MECKHQAVIYTQPNCPACVNTKRLLERYDVCIEEKVLGQDVTIEQMYDAINYPARSVPQVVLDGVYLHNLTKVKEHLERAA